METKYKIHLWVVGEGWKLFEVDRNSKELKDRNISIGDGASTANYVLPMNIALPPGYKINVTIGTTVAAGYYNLAIVTGKQIGRASCRERVCLYV